MYYTRYVTIDKKGRQRVAFRSMGDATGDAGIEIDAPGSQTPAQQVPPCPQGMFYVAGSGCVAPPDSGSALVDWLKSGVASVTGAITGAVDSAGGAVDTAMGPAASTQVATAPSSGAGASGAGLDLGKAAIIAAVGYGAYKLFFKKRRK